MKNQRLNKKTEKIISITKVGLIILFIIGVVIKGVNINESIHQLVNVDTNFSIPSYINSYAIDPTTIAQFTEATVTVIAQGTELWKCKDWNFSEQSWYCEWIKLIDITPGENYTFELTPEDLAFGEKDFTAEELWPMAPGNWWLFENDEGNESYLFEIEECGLAGKKCFTLVKKDLLANIIAINYVLFDDDALYKIKSKIKESEVDYSTNPIPILYTGSKSKKYHGEVEKQRDLDVELNFEGIVNLTTKVGEFEAYALKYHTRRSKNNVTIVDATYTIYYARGVGPVRIDWIDRSVHKLKEYMIK